jgi:hypothetical protein
VKLTTFRGFRAPLLVQVLLSLPLALPLALAGLGLARFPLLLSLGELPAPVASFELLLRRLYGCGPLRLCDRLLGVCESLRLCVRLTCVFAWWRLSFLRPFACGLSQPFLQLSYVSEWRRLSFQLFFAWGSSLASVAIRQGI